MPHQGWSSRWTFPKPPDENPTAANNVETLSNVPHILAEGPDWLRQWGTDASPGTMCFIVAGDVEREGVFEATRTSLLMQSLFLTFEEEFRDHAGHPCPSPRGLGPQDRGLGPGGRALQLRRDLRPQVARLDLRLGATWRATSAVRPSGPRSTTVGVRMQQGQVQVDADWNEQADIWAHLLKTVARDLIGPCGGPARRLSPELPVLRFRTSRG